MENIMFDTGKQCLEILRLVGLHLIVFKEEIHLGPQ